MSTLPENPDQPDRARESRLLELRREAERRGRVQGLGVRPAGAPFPVASSRSGYYGLPLLKEPQWQWQVPLYFFVGGAAGAAGVLGSLADLAGDDYALARHARWMALGGSMLSGALLVWDLGRPARFLNMLRVFKPQSPMSMGAWVLTAFSGAAAAASFADVMRGRYGDKVPVRIISGAGRLGSALFGLPFHNYTGVLLGATVIPVWNRSVGTLPIHFGMSGVQSAACLLELMGHSESRTLNLLAVLSSAWETLEGAHLEARRERALEPLKHGLSGWITRAGGLLSGPLPLTLRLLAQVSGNDSARRLATWSGLAGSLLTRYGWMLAGRASARDWRVPLEISQEQR